MIKNNFQNIANDFIPSEEKLISLKKVVEECKKKKIPMTLRTLTYYSTNGYIPKPIHIKNSAYYEKGSILDELQALYILKTVLHCSLDEIGEIAANQYVTLKDVVGYLHALLGNLYANWSKRDKPEALIFMLVNEKVPQFVVKRFLDGIKQGNNPELIDLGKFIGKVFDKMQKEKI